jgi:hypothetical protein
VRAAEVDRNGWKALHGEVVAANAELEAAVGGLTRELGVCRARCADSADKASRAADAMRELGSKQDHLVDEVLSLQNNAKELEDKLARVVRASWRTLRGSKAVL